ncbi:neuraminidase-like domain-containing protein [Pseudomonas sp. LB3P14]
MASIDNIGGLQEKRRRALVAYCIGQIPKSNPKYRFMRTAQDLSEVLRLDTQDSYAVQSSWVAEATSCSQQLIHGAYRKLELGYEKVDFDSQDLAAWRFSSNYSDWAAMEMIKAYPENFIDSSIRLGETSLFKTLKNNLNQTRLTTDSVRSALHVYLEAFAKICNLDLVSGFMDGSSPGLARYYFVARTRSDPRKYFWRMADVELGDKEPAINPAAWTEWLEMEIPADGQILDLRPVFWNGQLCVVWALWRDRVEGPANEERLPDKLDICLAFKRQNDQWSAPTILLTKEYAEQTPPVGTRLIATVCADYENPKGKLGVMLTNDKMGAGALKEPVVRDVFLRALPHDKGSWLEYAALHRFKSGDMIQHSLRDQPTVIAGDNPAGTLTPYLGLHATAFREGTNDVLVVQGYCWLTGLTAGGNVALTLTLQDRVPGEDPEPITEQLALAGGWSTSSLVFKRPAGAWTNPAIFTFGNATGAGSKKFALTIKNVTSFNLPKLHKNARNAAQFLSLNQPNLDLKFTRLNTLFAPELLSRASVSVEAVLEWPAQFLPEPVPDIPGSFSELNGAFDGANGRNFWELFFHLAHLVATRLRDEDRFQEAQDWWHHLFDPQAPAADATAPAKPKPRYWRCRPLDTDGNPGGEALAPLDPDAIAYAAPTHYKILVFCEYVRTLMAQGDWHYRH